MIRRRQTRDEHGFTMLEVLVVISILAILAALAVPSMGDLIRTSRVRGASFELQAAFFRARSEAINRNTEVELVPRSADWRNGWVLQVVGGPVIEDRQVLANVTVTPSPAPTVRYRINGRIGAGSQSLVISDPGSATTHARCITLSANGRAKSEIDIDFDPTDGCI